MIQMYFLLRYLLLKGISVNTWFHRETISLPFGIVHLRFIAQFYDVHNENNEVQCVP